MSKMLILIAVYTAVNTYLMIIVGGSLRSKLLIINDSFSEIVVEMIHK